MKYLIILLVLCSCKQYKTYNHKIELKHTNTREVLDIKTLNANLDLVLIKDTLYLALDEDNYRFISNDVKEYTVK